MELRSRGLCTRVCGLWFDARLTGREGSGDGESAQVGMVGISNLGRLVKIFLL